MDTRMQNHDDKYASAIHESKTKVVEPKKEEYEPRSVLDTLNFHAM